MAEHTPGPWTAKGSTIQITENFLMSPQWNENVDRDEIDQEFRANARLIAAAPALLEALENLENDAGQIPEHAWKIVCAAIAAAKGETNE